MALATSDSDEYVPDSGDSQDSDFGERPNRWTGPPSTWQQLNNAEIDTFTALNEIRNQDLAAHLFNAFALKQRHNKLQDTREPAAGKDINAATGQIIEQDDWVPHRSWTAWPMRADKVPHPMFMGRTDDTDEKFTFRKTTHEMPSTALEETLSAAVLRTAKDKFKARPSTKPSIEGLESGLEDSDHGSDVDTFSKNRRARSESRSIKYDSATEADKMDIDEIRGRTPPYMLLEKRNLKPIVATDDDLSNAILRPSIRHVLSKLDATLTILHHARDSALNYQSDSADSDASDSSRRSRRSSRDRSQLGVRKRGRPLRPREASQVRSSAPPESPTDTRKGAGRPRKIYPRLDDETDQEYTVRIARLRKEPVPIFAKLNTESEAKMKEELAPDEDREYSAGSERDSSDQDVDERNTKLKRKRARRESPETPQGAPDMNNMGRRRIGLRDWGDVLGAAALAGFPPSALDRAARRCANLFGQSMVLQTLPEAPPGRTAPGKVTRYEPGMPLPPLLPSEDGDGDGADGDIRDDDIDIALHIARRSRSKSIDFNNSGSRHRSVSRGRPLAQSRSATPAPRGRSRSRSAGGTEHFCPFGDCPRAVDGFARRQNMARHMKLVHGVDGDNYLAAADVDSEDEMHGAVHVDGFLRPIRARPGWRAGDLAEEPRRRGRSRGRSRGRGEDGEESG